jgi:hypothetical protein
VISLKPDAATTEAEIMNQVREKYWEGYERRVH